MLIDIEVKIELPIILFLVRLSGRFEQVIDVIVDKQRMPQNTHDFNDRPANLMLVFDNTHVTIRDDGNMYLNTYGILTFSPEGFDLEVLLDPFEEQFDLPPILIEECNVGSLEIEVVRVVGKRPFEFRCIVDNPSDGYWVVSVVPLARKTYRLVSEHIVFTIKDIFSFHDHIVGMKLLPDDEECSRLLNGRETGEVKVSSIKHVARQGFILKPVHGIEVADVCIADSVENRYLRNDVNLGMNLDAGLRGFELCPPENSEAKVNGRGVDGIESSMKFKLFGDTQSLCPANHVEGKILVDPIVTKSVGFRDDISSRGNLPESEMIRPFGMSVDDVCKFPKTGAACELAIDKHKKMVPMSECPTLRPVVAPFHDTIELTLDWRDDLLKNVLSCMHNCTNNDSGPKVSISNAGHAFLELIRCA